MEKNTQNKENLNQEIETQTEENLESTQEVEELSNEEKLELQVKELKNDYLRVHADFENFRKRNQEEIIKIKERTVSNFVQDLLPSIDNFEMSLKMSDNKEMFIKGVEMIHKNLLEILQNHSISIYEPSVGDKFDPIHHEPILIEHEEHEPGTILGVLSKGYKLKDSILRPARVQVVKDSSDDEEKEEE